MERLSMRSISSGDAAAPPMLICFSEDRSYSARLVEHEQRAGHGGHQRHGGGALVLNQAADRRGIEPAHHHLLQPHHGGGLGAPPAVGVEQRDGVQLDAVVVVIEDARDGHGMHVDGAVRQHHALRRSRAAAGVEKLGDGVLVVSQNVGALRRARARENPRIRYRD